MSSLMVVHPKQIFAVDPTCPSGCGQLKGPIGGKVFPGCHYYVGPVINPLSNCGAATICPEDNNYYYIFDPTNNTCLPQEKKPVYLCYSGDCQTAVGNITLTHGYPTGLVKFVLQFAFGISGGIILLMTIATGYMVLTSSGNPEKLQGAKENLVSIFSGLILIAFSLVLLQAIGADILKLPTF